MSLNLREKKVRNLWYISACRGTVWRYCCQELIDRKILTRVAHGCVSAREQRHDCIDISFQHRTVLHAHQQRLINELPISFFICEHSHSMGALVQFMVRTHHTRIERKSHTISHIAASVHCTAMITNERCCDMRARSQLDTAEWN